MSYQEHLPQTCGQLPHQSRLPSTYVWFITLILLVLFILLSQNVSAVVNASTATSSNDSTISINNTLLPRSISLSVSAARGDSWYASSPPTSGWTPVTLPDAWVSRWPTFNGVVWYKLTWNQPAPVQTTGVFITYLCMAGAIYINGSLIEQDSQLIEPLTRAWNTPRYKLISAPLLQAGNNTLLIRVSGFAALQAGLGPVIIGAPEPTKAHYNHEYLTRHDLQMFSLAISTTVGCFFFVLWLLRIRESVYGWFTLMSLSWLIVGINQIATTVWPFKSTNAWEAVNTTAVLIFTSTFTLFIIRFFNRHWPRFEAILIVLTVINALFVLLTPESHMGIVRAIYTALCGLIIIANCIFFLYMTWHDRKVEQLLLAAYIFVVMVADIHDMLTFLNVIHSNIYYAALASNLLLIGMALVLAWRFASSLRRIEHFNDELQLEVNHAKTELAIVLKHQYDLEINHARIGERLNLVRDLHDGLGSTLIGTIATLENAPEQVAPNQILDAIKEVRDDLRLIIESATTDYQGAHCLQSQLAPLRYRLSNLLDAHNINCHWHLSGLDQLQLSSAQSLDILRFVQESLTNVIKHSQAKNVTVHMTFDNNNLVVEIVDDGIGFENAIKSSQGTGLNSIQARAARLNATLRIESSQGQTRIRLIKTITIDDAKKQI